jgi:RHS repeat-associated protein
MTGSFVRTTTLATAVVLALGVGAVATGSRSSSAGHARPPKPFAGAAASDVHALKPSFAKRTDHANGRYVPTAVTWPAAGQATMAIQPPAEGQRQGARSAAANQPLSVRAIADGSGRYAGPDQVGTRLVDHAAALRAGVSGLVFAVDGRGTGSGTVRVGVDYTGFREAYGANFGSRLRLVRLPACALTTPQLPECRVQSPLGSTNDPAARQVSAEVSLAAGTPAVVLAATTGSGQDGGAGGTYAATTLKPSGSWSGGSSTGSFGYSYPLSVPAAASSLAPKIGLSYDSGSVDGQTASTQAQASWVGDGWTMPDSYVEQSFVSCADSPEGSPAPVSTSDNCYAGPVLTLSLNGATNALVFDAATSAWKLQEDNGEVIRHVTGSGNGTGTYNTDYWTLTGRDGTVYSFGLNQLPGWSAGKPTTNSVSSEPVFSAHAGDPCYNATFASSWCTMAYRWSLDYVKDVHANAMAYYYQQDTNYYARFNGASSTSYVRDSHLDHIDYGFTDGNAYGTVPDKVVFGTGPRCVATTCTPLSASTKANWPDVPYDLVCAAGAACTSQSPAFFSTTRLTSITTQQYATASASYAPVDTYAFAQTIPPTGDGTSPTLWLSSITHTGSDLSAGGSTTPITLPAVTFTGAQLPNRVDTVTDGLPPMYRYRIQTVTTETGSVISPTYSLVSPCSAPVTLDPASNTSSCYPVLWTPDGYTKPFRDWFNKYVVTKVVQTDPTGGAPALSTSYSYQGGAAWHYDVNEVVKPKNRTYGQFRGYGDVLTYLGDVANDPQTKSETRYYRGMSRNNSTVAVTLTDSQGGQHDDAEQLAGKELETTSYLGNGGPVTNSTITSYWISAPTASRDRTGLPALTANRVAPAELYTRRAVTSGATTTWRVTETDNTYDTSTGLPVVSYSHTVPPLAAYDSCTRTAYAPANTAANIVGLAAEVETDSVACGGFTQGSPASVPAALNTLTAPASVNRPAQVMGAARTYYDDTTYNTTFPQPSPPTKGDVTMVRTASGASGGVLQYQTQSRSAYDLTGRATASYDANGNQTTVSYAANSVGLPIGMTITNPLSQSASTTLVPTRGLVATQTDANGIVTTHRYDALGRNTAVWLASRPTSSPANYLFSYQDSNTTTTASTTNKLTEAGGYATATVIYDGLLRPRQRQTVTPNGGSLVSDTFYDSRGWVRASYNAWWAATSTPSTTLLSTTSAHDQDFYTYDGLGRVVRDDSANAGSTVSTTTTVYQGDRTTVVPPAGGVARTTLVDPLDRTTELDEYLVRPTVTAPSNPFTGTWTVSGGTTVATTYGYDGHGNRTTVTDANGSRWTSTFDLLGRATTKDDPDAGRTTISYDANGNLTQSTDARGRTISYTYDALSRRTGLYAATTAAKAPANQLAAWVYDNANNAVPGLKYPIGQLTTSIAYWSGSAYKTQVTGFNAFGESTGETITIPPVEGVLGASYTYTHVFAANTGLPIKDVYSAHGGLPAETVNYGYTNLDLPDTVGGAGTGFADGTSYDAWGRVSQTILGSAPSNGAVTNLYDAHTGRLNQQVITHTDTTTRTLDQEDYGYDPVGNITRQATTRLGAGTPTETQCYAYDGLARLANAWTATDNCAATPTTTSHAMVGDSLGPASAYWTTWTFDTVGNRAGQVAHSLTGGADTSTSYTYNGNGAGQPHTLTGTSAAGGTTYRYDASGNMTGRNALQGNQTLVWNDANRLTAVTGSTGGNSSFIYDTDGNLLLQKDQGSTTLYLPGEQLVLNTATNTVTGTRYYPLPGGCVAVRAGSAVSFQLGDLHGTPMLYLDNTVQNPRWRQSTPYGEPRGTSVTAPDNHAFLNQPANLLTGLIHLGARDYDPATGRFISVDPELDASDPQQLNGYSYADDNPVTNSDPTGLRTDDQYYGGAVKSFDSKQDTPGITSSTIPNDTPAPKHKSKPKHWWDKAANWVDKHKAQIAGFVAGAVVGIGCGVALGWTGVGAIACGALAGAVGSVVTDLVSGNRDIGSILTHAVVGAVVGGVMGGLGSVLGAAGKAAVGAARDGLRAAGRAAANAAGDEIKNIASGRAGGLVQDAVAGLRNSGTVGGGRNIAGANVAIDGQAPDLLLSVSGQAERAGTVPGIGAAGNPQRFIPTATGVNNRFADSEFKLLNFVANRLGASSDTVSGTIDLHSELPVCTSCGSVIGQFQRAFPNVTVNVTTG